MKAGERGVTMARCFNLKHGLTAKDDDLPERLFEPLKGGSQEGSAIPKDDFIRGKKLYHEMNGWDGETGIPSKGRMYELSLGWIAEELGTCEVTVSQKITIDRR